MTSEKLIILIQKMLDITYNMDYAYCQNVYVVSKNGIYFSKNNKLYNSYNDKITEKTNINLLKNDFNKMNSFFSNNFNDTIIKKDNTVINNNMNSFFSDNFNDEPPINMELNIIEKKNNKVIIKEEKTQPPVKSQEELELIKLIEETMEIYQKEVQNKREIEKHIKILDDNKKSINKKNMEKNLTNLSKLKNDYDTYKKITKKQSVKPELQIPELFLLKNNFFNELLKNDKYKNILEQISELDLDQVLNQGYDLNDDIKQITDKYGSESKKLNVKFDHSWEDLEFETEPTEQNNSRLGSLH